MYAQLTVIMLLLSRLVGGWAAIAALVTTISVMPVSAWFGGRQSASRARLIGLTDARVKLCSEAVSGAELDGEGRGGMSAPMRVAPTRLLPVRAAT